MTNKVVKMFTNPTFIAANAHCWFAFAVMVMLVQGLHWGGALASFVCVCVAAGKEFWFDAKYEIPPQTLEDGAMDFAGYMAGLLIAMYTFHWWAA